MKKILLTLVAAIATLTASAICQGTSTGVDNFYTSSNDKAVKSLTKGFTWQCETSGSNVNISVTFLDALAGMAAPYLFNFDNKGVLIGDPLQMNWDGATRTATYTLTNQTKDAKISFLVNVALEAGAVLYTERVSYVVGSTCDSQEEQPVASCSGKGTGTDTYYASTGSFTKGFEWTCNTMANNDVQLEFKYLDYFAGMASPMLFKFHMVGTNEELDGDPIAMDWTGTVASYTFKGCKTGDKLRFLVQIAYEAGGVIYSERIEYTVGQDCQEETAIEKTYFPSREDRGEARKLLIDGHLYLQYNGQIHSVVL